MHLKALTEKPAIYPQRAPVSLDQVEWDSPFENYRPNYYVADVVLKEYDQKREKGWADPEDIHLVSRKILSLIQKLQFDGFNRPLNPMGRTGIYGRGLLGKWGPNFAADVLLTRKNPTSQKIEGLFILRSDRKQWAIPGGMLDYGENALLAAKRELKEETGANTALSSQDALFKGYVDDPRNTDNAWMETTFFHRHLKEPETSQLTLQSGDDALQAEFKEINESFLKELYASHEKLVQLALSKLNEDL